MYDELIESADEAYTSALAVAATLSPADTVRLGAMLNYTVFCANCLRSPERAALLSKLAFDEAFAELDSFPKEQATVQPFRP